MRIARTGVLAHEPCHCAKRERLRPAVAGLPDRRSIDPSLLLNYSVRRVEFPPVVSTSVHETAAERCRLVETHARFRFQSDEPYSGNVLIDGPWEGSEIGKELVTFAGRHPDLREAFDRLNTQRLVADLRPEASREVRRQLVSEPAGSTPVLKADSSVLRQSRKKRGRKPVPDPAQDKNIADNLTAGRNPDDLSKELGIPVDELSKRAWRHERRQERLKSSAPTNSPPPTK